MSGGAPAQTSPGAAPGEERISTLVGDRLCIGCGYNLTGQPVVREPHYKMLIARCPECGMVACLQEYPVLGRWAGRWAGLLAAAWLGVLLIAVLACGGILFGQAMGVADDASAPWAKALAERFAEDLKAQGNPNPAAQWMLQSGPTRYSQLDPGWLSRQDLEAILAAAGGWRAVTDVGALRGWVWVALSAFPMGCFWAMALLHVRRRRLALVALVPVALAAAILAVDRFESSAQWLQFGWIPAYEVARRYLGLAFEAVTLAFALLPLVLGLMVGRPVIRGLVRALLPPRLRGALALLWTAEGLAPPPATGRRTAR